MKTIRNIMLGMLFPVTLYSCQGNSTTPNTNDHKPKPKTCVVAYHKFPQPQSPFSRFIPIDSANRMISSYLESIDYTHNDSDLRSIIFEADSLEKYIHVARAGGIKKIK